MFLKSATVVSAAGDNSCLYHSLSFLLCRENLYDKNGCIMRQQLNNYIRDNLFKVVWTSPRNSKPFCEAIRGEGFTTSGYYARMALDSSWGGSIEIIATTEIFKVNIEVYVISWQVLQENFLACLQLSQ